MCLRRAGRWHIPGSSEVRNTPKCPLVLFVQHLAPRGSLPPQGRQLVAPTCLFVPPQPVHSGLPSTLSVSPGVIFLHHNPPGLESSSSPFPPSHQLCFISSSQQWDLLTHPVHKKHIPVRNDHTFSQHSPQGGFIKNSRAALSCHYRTTLPISSLKKAGKTSESRFSL